LSLRFLIVVFIFSTLISCEKKHLQSGKVFVRSMHEGHYEIYRVNSDAKRLFYAEFTGEFNKSIDLEPGNYLLIADCSSKSIVVRPNSNEIVNMHLVKFVSTVEPTPQSKFVVECRRTEDLAFRQKIEGRFELDVLEGQTEVLVGMTPLSFDFSPTKFTEPQTHQIPISSIVVRSQRETSNTNDFFVSRVYEEIALTESQIFDERIFVLPGSYKVELNGTSQVVNLETSQHHEMEVGYFGIETSPEVDIASSLEVRGMPLNVIVNEDHAVALNEVFPALPGKLELRLFGSDRRHELEIVAGVESGLKVRSVTIDSSCSAWYWECLGRRKVYLYEEGKTYAFAEGVTDVPLLFLGEDAWVGIEGSYDIRYQLPTKKRDTLLNLGFVTIHPEPVLSKSYLTDLIRIEASGQRFIGHTLDVDLLQESTFPLIPGYYVASGYSSMQSTSNKRVSFKKGFVARKGDKIEIKVTVYLPKSRYNKFLSQRKKLEHQRIRAVESKWKSAYRPGKRLSYQ
jgi:hypothetical protein